jgi:hypothetical protein
MAHLRLQLDPVARLGIPAHVTVLFLFMPASEIPRPNPTMTRTATRPAWSTPRWQSAADAGNESGGALSGFSFAVGISHAAATVEIGDPSTEQR